MKRRMILLLCCWLGALSVLEAKDEKMTVRLRDGRIQEYVKGSLRRSYGSNLIDCSTDGELVAAVTRYRRIAEFRNGSQIRTYGSKVVRVRVVSGTVFADLENGRTAEYVNGSLRRTF